MSSTNAASVPDRCPEHRTVLITGGNRGIGRACADAFAALGDRVAVTTRGEPVPGFFSVKCDVRIRDEVDAAVDAVEREFGKQLQVVVANAGVTADHLSLVMKDEAFEDVVATNLSGAFYVARRAARSMMRARDGRIVFVGSVVGFMGAPGQANYAASKAALVGLARSMARELGPRHVTVNVVVPGAVDTDMLAAVADARRSAIQSAIPLGRLATAEEVASTVTFVASRGASYMTGAVLPVDGGLGMGM